MVNPSYTFHCAPVIQIEAEIYRWFSVPPEVENGSGVRIEPTTN